MWKKRGNGFTLMHLGNVWIRPKPKCFSHNLLSVQMLPSTQNRIVSSVLWVKVTIIMIWASIWVWINTYENTIFRGMNVHKSQLFWCELQRYQVFTPLYHVLPYPQKRCLPRWHPQQKCWCSSQRSRHWWTPSYPLIHKTNMGYHQWYQWYTNIDIKHQFSCFMSSSQTSSQTCIC